MAVALKLVHSREAQSKRSLPICAVLHRASGNIYFQKRRVRRYSCIDNAIAGVNRWMYQHGRVGDTIAIYHNLTGLEIGTVKMSLKGRIVTRYIFED